MPFWKELPQAVDRRKRKRDSDRDEDLARKQVREYWHYRCRVCGRRTSVVHEEKRRGAGGVVSLRNSYLACDVVDGGVCHPLLQTYRIWAVMENGSDTFDARKPLVFEMSEAIAKLVFEGRPRPPHIRITEEA